MTSGAEIKAQVMEALDTDLALNQDTECRDALLALAPCIVLTEEEAALLAKPLHHPHAFHDPCKPCAKCALLALLTPADTEKPDEDIGPPAPGEWNEDDYPNPEPKVKC